MVLSIKIDPLSEPTDNRVTFASLDWRNFVDRLGSESDQQSGLACKAKGAGLIVKVQRAATEAMIDVNEICGS